MSHRHERKSSRESALRARWCGIAAIGLAQLHCGSSSIILDPVIRDGAADAPSTDDAIAARDANSDADTDSGSCGALQEPCCAASRCTGAMTQCEPMSNRCVACGGGGQRCCAGSMCTTGVCSGGVCPRPSCPTESDPSCRIIDVPGGTFTVAENIAGSEQRNITVSPFAMDATEVTVARFRRYYPDINMRPSRPPPMIRYPGGWYATAQDTPPVYPSDGVWRVPPAAGEQLPVVGMEIDAAQGFCVWEGGRLPTEAEFEWVAYATTHDGRARPRLYPWGNEAPSPTCDRAQWNDCPGDSGSSVRRVASFAPTGGFYDLAGNVQELTADQYAAFNDPRCWGGVARVNPLCVLPGAPLDRTLVARGGEWGNLTPPQLPSARSRSNGASRNAGGGTSTSQSVGFRCVYDR